MQLRICFLDCRTATLFCGTLILRIPADGIGFSTVGEYQFHLGGCFRLGIFGAKHRWVPVISAGFSVEGIGDSIEDGSLTRTGVPSDQVEPLLTQLFQINGHRPCIRPKGGYSQFQWSHSSPSSQICSIHIRAKACCSSPIGCPFCRV